MGASDEKLGRARSNSADVVANIGPIWANFSQTPPTLGQLGRHRRVARGAELSSIIVNSLGSHSQHVSNRRAACERHLGAPRWAASIREPWSKASWPVRCDAPSLRRPIAVGSCSDRSGPHSRPLEVALAIAFSALKFAGMQLCKSPQQISHVLSQPSRASQQQVKRTLRAGQQQNERRCVGTSARSAISGWRRGGRPSGWSPGRGLCPCEERATRGEASQNRFKSLPTGHSLEGRCTRFFHPLCFFASFLPWPSRQPRRMRGVRC